MWIVTFTNLVIGINLLAALQLLPIVGIIESPNMRPYKLNAAVYQPHGLDSLSLKTRYAWSTYLLDSVRISVYRNDTLVQYRTQYMPRDSVWVRKWHVDSFYVEYPMNKVTNNTYIFKPYSNLANCEPTTFLFSFDPTRSSESTSGGGYHPLIESNMYTLDKEYWYHPDVAMLHGMQFGCRPKPVSL